MKILVADNSKIGLAILTASLTALGHDVIGASTGDQAIDLFMKKRPDFIILDALMQGMSGFECAKKMRNLYSEHWIPIIFLSTTIDDDSISQGIDAGGDDYLTKPFSNVTLAAKIKAMQRITDVQRQLHETKGKLVILSSTDVLTGVDNRLQFNKDIYFQIKFANRYNTKLALLLLDLDNFKDVNDHLGHQMGDLLLEEVAGRLKSCIRANDFLARLGGDEFAIILSKINDVEEACVVAQKILDILEPVYHLAEHDIHISCSIGIADYPTTGNTAELLIQHANMAMYYTKESGRNTFQYYSEKLQAQHNQRFFLENALRFAVENNELFMCYQPIFNLQTQKIVGVEALTRWKHPQFGFIAPETFIPIAEDTGLITSIGQWAFHHACKQGSIWHQQGFKNLKLAINISSQQFLQADLLQFIIDTLDGTKFPPHLLELELTESTLISDLNCIDKILNEISTMKIGISLDDFGTGYSSLSYLKRLPICTLKIDKSFLLDIATNSTDAVIVQAVIALGKILKLHVIAEGVETEEQLNFLIKHKCQEGQGFYLSKPLTAEHMSTLLHTKNTQIKR